MENENKLEYTFDFSSMVLAKNIVECRQEGNTLIAVTDQNITFRHRLPSNKILNKKDGKFVIEDMEIAN